MKVSGQQVFKALVVAMAAATAVGVQAAGAKGAATTAAAKAQHWSASTGTGGVRGNRDLAGDIGLTLGTAQSRQGAIGADDHEFFDLQASASLDFNVRSGNLDSFVGGELRALGGYSIQSKAAGSIDLTNFRLVPRVGAMVPTLDVVGADGKA